MKLHFGRKSKEGASLRYYLSLTTKLGYCSRQIPCRLKSVGREFFKTTELLIAAFMRQLPSVFFFMFLTWEIKKKWKPRIKVVFVFFLYSTLSIQTTYHETAYAIQIYFLVSGRRLYLFKMIVKGDLKLSVYNFIWHLNFSEQECPWCLFSNKSMGPTLFSN